MPTRDTGRFAFPEISTWEVTDELHFLYGSDDQAGGSGFLWAVQYSAPTKSLVISAKILRLLHKLP